MKICLIALMALLKTGLCAAQVQEEWAARYHSGPQDAGTAVAVDEHGNVYVVGTTGVIVSTGHQIAIIKYSSAGGQQWAVTHNSEMIPRAMTIDQRGNVYVGGSVLRDIPPFGDRDYSLNKYDSTGVLLWNRRYAGPGIPGNSGDDITAVVVDQDGNVYVTGGVMTSGNQGSNPVTIKYSPAGVQLWIAQYDRGPTYRESGVSLAVDAQGNVYVICQSSPDEFGGGAPEFLTIKYNSSGVQQWVRRYNASSFDYGDIPTSVELDQVGNVYVTGSTQLQDPGTSRYSVATVKYDSDGVQQWAVAFDSSQVQTAPIPKLVVDQSGNVFVSSSYQPTLSILDIVTIKYNSAGNQQWFRKYNGPANSGDGFSALALDEQGSVYVAGSSPGVGTSLDYVTIKYTTAGDQRWVTRYNGPANNSDGASALVVDHYGNVYVTGRSWGGSPNNFDFATIKYSQLHITRPLAGDRWIAGGQDTIRLSGRQLGQFVAVDYSTDSGSTYTNITSSLLADSLIWSIPANLLTTRAKIRVRTITAPPDTAVSDTFKIKWDVLTRMNAIGHYEAFSPRKHGWSYLNGTLWPSTWWNQFQYSTGSDPNTGAPYPVAFQSSVPSTFVDWPLLWVSVFSTSACYWSTAFPGSYNGTAQTKWASGNILPHSGSCEGFAISSFLAFNYPSQFFPRHGIPNVDSLFRVPLTNTVQSTINFYYAHQYGKPAMDYDVVGQAKDPRTTLQEIRNMFRGDSVDIRPILIYNLGILGGAHTMAPISVTVDGSGPSRYRVNLYDSNNPGVSTPYILIDSLANTWTDFSGLGWGPSSTHCYLGIPVSSHLTTPVMGRPPSGYSPRGLNNIEFYNNANADVVYTASNGNRIGFVNGTVVDELQDGIAIFNRTGRPSKPIGYYIPDGTYSAALTNVKDSSGGAHVTVLKDDVVYRYTRANNDSLLTDRLHFGSGFSVASPDTSQKQISMHVIARLDSSERIFFIRNTRLRQNDSLYVKEMSQSDLMLKNYGTGKTYDLALDTRSRVNQRLFENSSIALEANSTHTIVPNWNNLGLPIPIYIDLGNNGTIDDTIFVNNTVDVDDRGSLQIPTEYNLAQNYPNPFNPSTLIKFALPQNSQVKLVVYNQLGQEVARLVDEERPAGRHEITWNAASVASGVYFYKMEARGINGASSMETKKMLLLK